jgi:hypothetical protein
LINKSIRMARSGTQAQQTYVSSPARFQPRSTGEPGSLSNACP